ncbi:MAG: bifunctional (p)ppGpp synthetase/guanosine-3',5'-bis(diphosphate) 3'-pyrophosphohydrolase [Brevefilum sp.]|nr:bifunctional (p)ppGpp synthetase/guanosine-3',5'-bis(diphosphate) 3'-pyrophosphohydrolase [Brevefilum sp.]MDT8381419.1 bifunctional (p)ppGpp synthetase/guanosine-3',5'-bis(diphosphate) 3'-pyrophosphohydrolase [Brevefilum sp.]MDW7754313.1 bifunctional (p)ppGpp synthetase/guanosine-3',5'-bis(diphosphate) 3'-pyrophosphohydrolase [Brevefilum sp.]
MQLEQFLEKLPENYSVLDIEQIKKAYQIAHKAHEGQTLPSGLPYISHCVAVATILAEMTVPPELIITALLHDAVEDTNITLEDIRKEFNQEVATLVDGVTKLTHLPNLLRGDQHKDIPGKEKAQTPHRKVREDEIAETLRKTFLAMSDDIRVVLVKLADRLHNMRTLSYLEEDIQKRIAQETLDIFAPLANRLGIWQIKWELEDLAFRYVSPNEYKSIAEKLANRRADREKQIQEIINRLHKELGAEGIKAKISGRPKHIYSIYQKMVQKEKPFEMLMDLRGVRLIVEDVAACYKALGVVHMKWRPIPGEFDDYIASKKDNNYQSLHTAVIFDDGKPLEVQIRTQDMHESAEFGIAAHWRYKEDQSNIKESYQQKISWLRSLFAWQQDEENADELVDSWKSDVFKDRVYVLTPQGDIIDLPAGSTPIDFAYHVHTEIGHRCRGAKINGKLVSLDYLLQTGDQVEVLTAKRGGPSRDWLNTTLGLVHTSRARSKIKQWFKKQDRDSNLAQGKAILEKEFKRLGLKSVNFDEILSELNVKTIDDLYVAIGCGDIGSGRVINKLAEIEDEELEPELEFDLVEAPSTIVPSDAVKVMGLKGIATTMAKCCNPMPGDEIIGYITRGRGATIHRADCPNILRVTEKERLVEVSWGQPGKTFTVPIQIKAYDRQGLMGDISNVIADESINLIDMSLKMNQHLAVIKIVLGVQGISQLSRVLTKLENLPNVFEAKRQRPG